MANKDFTTNPAYDFITTPAPTSAPVSEEPGLDSLQIPEGYVLKKVARSKRIQTLVAPVVYEALKDEGRELGLSLSSLVSDILEKHISDGNL